ncbi:putative component of NuA3 histone acetyltransferase complex [Tieghemiomyces parasiticus]|uniref:Component of NuA3 histone acetyltransferase complex n=1 Tax=Tieghemiomyces parasiticus TaxID=78921 RepID=A0A9W8DNG9_9FUNG|nr:putative component of NuA3 histone acetyltransferase complex [Tieghemiomyces parasiticus]
MTGTADSSTTPAPKRPRHEPDAPVATDTATFCEAFHACHSMEAVVPNPARRAHGRDSVTTVGRVHGDGPFSVGLLPSLFPESLLRQARQELGTLAMVHKSNDLYEFYQSPDLGSAAEALSLPALIQLRDTIYSPEFASTMHDLTGIELHPRTVDLSAHRYPPGGYLLCHDDDIRRGKEGRRLAFIIYLVSEDWSAADGGALDLFDKDRHGQPVEAVTSILPQWNTFVFFEVGTTSFHQVAEVLGTRTRVSISGWFHGPIPTSDDSPSDHTLVPRPLVPTTYPLDQFITTEYLTPGGMARINQVFLDQSSIELQGFLLPAVYDTITAALCAAPWIDRTTGPANAMRYRRHLLAEGDEESEVDASLATGAVLLSHLQRLFASVMFAELLARFTNLDALAECTSEWRSFSPGDYTLLNDLCLEPEGLDVILSCPQPLVRSSEATPPPFEWDETWQGAMHYIADQETLLTLWPKSNTLSIVFRDTGTLRFVKYLNHRAQGTRTELSVTFYERP